MALSHSDACAPSEAQSVADGIPAHHGTAFLRRWPDALELTHRHAGWDLVDLGFGTPHVRSPVAVEEPAKAAFIRATAGTRQAGESRGSGWSSPRSYAKPLVATSSASAKRYEGCEQAAARPDLEALLRMVIIEWRRGPIRLRKAIFASTDEAAELTVSHQPSVVTKFGHALFDPSDGPAGMAMRPIPDFCIDLTKEPDELLGRMSRSSCRQEVRRVERLGDRVRIESDGATVARDFLALQRDFLSWKKFHSPISHSLLERYLASSDLFAAYLDGRPLSGHLVVRDEARRRVMVEFSASARNYWDEGAKWSGAVNRYLHWHEILYYRSIGFLVYDFGGFTGDENGPDGVGYFKQSLRGYLDDG